MGSLREAYKIASEWCSDDSNKLVQILSAMLNGYNLGTYKGESLSKIGDVFHLSLRCMKCGERYSVYFNEDNINEVDNAINLGCYNCIVLMYNYGESIKSDEELEEVCSKLKYILSSITSIEDYESFEYSKDEYADSIIDVVRNKYKSGNSVNTFKRVRDRAVCEKCGNSYSLEERPNFFKYNNRCVCELGDALSESKDVLIDKLILRGKELCIEETSLSVFSVVLRRILDSYLGDKMELLTEEDVNNRVETGLEQVLLDLGVEECIDEEKSGTSKEGFIVCEMCGRPLPKSSFISSDIRICEHCLIDFLCDTFEYKEGTKPSSYAIKLVTDIHTVTKRIVKVKNNGEYMKHGKVFRLVGAVVDRFMDEGRFRNKNGDCLDYIFYKRKSGEEGECISNSLICARCNSRIKSYFRVYGMFDDLVKALNSEEKDCLGVCKRC